MSYKLTSRGDTIIEVLISIAIIGLGLAGAYATANHSAQNDLSTQEREIAITIAQSQLEQLNNLPTAGSNSLATIATASASCFSDTQVLDTTPSTYATDCVNYDSSAYPEGFTVDIKQSTAANPNPSFDKPLATFEVTVDWGAPGGGNDDLQMYYQPAGSS